MELISRIANGEFRRIIVLTGAGVSTDAGIPDFRSNNGLFSKLMKEFPEAKSPSDIFSQFFLINIKWTPIQFTLK
jgi:NAD-dependent SIR2 family protein deacetylase